MNKHLMCVVGAALLICVGVARAEDAKFPTPPEGYDEPREGIERGKLEEQKVPHEYRIIPEGRHDFAVWKSDLYHFAQLLFR